MQILPFAPVRAADVWRLTNLHRLIPLSFAEYMERDARWPSEDFRRRWLGFEGDRSVSFGELAYSSYVPGDHRAVRVIVDAQWRGGGRGSAMLAFLENEAKAFGARALSATFPEAALEARGWAQKRGFADHARRCDCILDLQTFDQPERKTRNVAFSDMTDATDADWICAAELMQTLVADAPDMREVPHWDVKRCHALLRGAPAARPEWIIIATKDGKAIGLTVGHSMGEGIYIFFTGVLSKWRGQGLARELKARLIRSARRLGITTMRCTNLDANIPALRLNEALGFRRVPGSVEMRKRLALA